MMGKEKERSPVWKKSTLFPLYEVSSCGEVRADLSRRMVTPYARNGYLRVHLITSDSTRHWVPVHTLVLDAFTAPRPTPRHEGAHKDGNRQNNYATNLVWKTRHANEADKRAHGTHPKTKPPPRLDVAVRRKIVSLLRQGHTNSRIATLLSIHRKTVATYRRQHEAP